MMNVTLAALKEQARQRADQVNSGFVSDAELLGYINLSLTELYDLLVAAYGDDYYLSSTTITADGTNDTYSIPATFYKLAGVDSVVDSQNSWAMKPYMFNERNRLGSAYFTGRTIDTGYRYHLQAQTMRFIPLPPNGKVFKLWFVPTCPLFAADGDTFDFINGWQEYVIIDAAIKMMQKEESDVSVLAAQKQAMRARLDTMKRDRDQGQPMRITDVRRGGYGADGYDADGGFSEY